MKPVLFFSVFLPLLLAAACTPSAPNSAPANTAPSQQPATSTVVPTQTVEPTQTLTPEPPTQTPTVVPTEMVRIYTEPVGWADVILNLKYGKCISLSTEENLFEKYLPLLPINTYQGWGYTPGIGGDFGCPSVIPWPKPKNLPVVGYWVSADRIQAMLLDWQYYDGIYAVPLPSPSSP